jgi:hypothetical protein
MLLHNGNKFPSLPLASSLERNILEPSGFAAKNIL